MSFLRPSAAKQTTSTIGTGTLTLNVNSGDTRSFQTAMGSGPIKGRFMLRGQGYFEMFRGTFTAPSTLTRDEPIISSNANALVSIPAGTTDVYLLDYAQFVVDSFSGTTKTLANADASNTWIFTGSAASVLNLPAISSALPDFWGFIRNAGTANLTLTAPGSDVIDETGTQTAVFAAGDSAFLYLDTSNTKWRLVRGAGRVSTPQVLTSGSGATYTTPAGVRQLRIRMWGGGGAGAANSNNAANGGAGGNTIFNGVNAAGGGGGTFTGSGGGGGSGGSGSASLRVPGNAGSGGYSIGTGFSTSGAGGMGAAGPLGGTPSSGNNAAANNGSGGSGGSGSSFNGTTGGGGGAGEYVEYIINTPAGSYTYTIGAAGTTTSAGTFGFGCNGSSGQIIVEERY